LAGRFGGDVSFVEEDFFAGQIGGQTGVDFGDVIEGEEAAANAGLVGNDEEFEAGLAQTAQGRRRAGKEDDLLRAAEVFSFFDQGAVPIEEDGARLIQVREI
jgi:hypothetical protein